MSSSYKGVSLNKATRKWQATSIIEGTLYHIGTYTREREAAIAVDIYRIKRGLEPCNILKRK
jgi:hypothetical protein